MKKLIAPLVVSTLIIIWIFRSCFYNTLFYAHGICNPPIIPSMNLHSKIHELMAITLINVIVIIATVILFFEAARKYRDLPAQDSKRNIIITIILTLACSLMLSPAAKGDFGSLLIISIPITITLEIVGIILFITEVIAARKKSNKSLRTTIDLMTHLCLIILWGGTLLYGIATELDNRLGILILLPFIASSITTLILTKKEKTAQPQQS